MNCLAPFVFQKMGFPLQPAVFSGKKHFSEWAQFLRNLTFKFLV